VDYSKDLDSCRYFTVKRKMHVKWASQNNRANVGQYRTDEVPQASAIRTSGDLSKGGIESGNIPLSDIPSSLAGIPKVLQFQIPLRFV